MVRSLIGLSINNHRNLKPATIEYAIILTNDTIKSDPENSFRTIETGGLHPIVSSIGRSYSTPGRSYLLPPEPPLVSNYVEMSACQKGQWIR
jgi:hypothetical protein